MPHFVEKIARPFVSELIFANNDFSVDAYQKPKYMNIGFWQSKKEGFTFYSKRPPGYQLISSGSLLWVIVNHEDSEVNKIKLFPGVQPNYDALYEKYTENTSLFQVFNDRNFSGYCVQVERNKFTSPKPMFLHLYTVNKDPATIPSEYSEVISLIPDVPTNFQVATSDFIIGYGGDITFNNNAADKVITGISGELTFTGSGYLAIINETVPT